MWMRIDDGLHAHRKTRALVRSANDKSRDAAPFGLWVLAGSWSARNNRDGWVPTEELDRFDDDWESLAKRLIVAGYWWPEEREGEAGYGFNDWGEWNNPDGASASGTFGNHVRWHVNKGVVKPGCELCPTEPNDVEPMEDDRPESHPTRPDDRPDIAPDSGGESGGESLRDHRPDSLTHTQPIPKPKPKTHRPAAAEPDGFEAWWDTYAYKEGRANAVKAYKRALTKTNAETLLRSAQTYIAGRRRKGKHPEFTKLPTTWLNGEHWNDETTSNVVPMVDIADLDLARLPPVESSWMRRSPS